MKIRVRTPATVANLGPGFDCLGLALDLWNEITVECIGDHLAISIEGEGLDSLPRDASNAIYQAMKTYADRHAKQLPAGIHLECINRIPLGSGLGSSSAATVSGILCAVALLDLDDDKQKHLQMAAELEGHPDNAAACLFGGFTMTIVDDGWVISKKVAHHPFPLLIVIPEFHFPTSLARAALPPQVSRQDATYNLGRVALLGEAFRNGDLELLSRVTDDRLHQPYRLPLIPGAMEAMQAARESGAAAVVLAGAGPSLMAFIADESSLKAVSESMLAAFRTAGLCARILTPSITNQGATTEAI